MISAFKTARFRANQCYVIPDHCPSCYDIRALLVGKYSRFFVSRLQNCEKQLLASSCLSVRPSAQNKLATSGRIPMKFDI
jgi:hypothetical protein